MGRAILQGRGARGHVSGLRGHLSGKPTNQASGGQPLNTTEFIDATGEISPRGVRRRRMDGFFSSGRYLFRLACQFSITVYGSGLSPLSVVLGIATRKRRPSAVQ